MHEAQADLAILVLEPVYRHMKKCIQNHYNTGLKKKSMKSFYISFILQHFDKILPEEKFTTAHEFGKPARKPRIASHLFQLNF